MLHTVYTESASARGVSSACALQVKVVLADNTTSIDEKEAKIDVLMESLPADQQVRERKEERKRERERERERENKRRKNHASV